MRRAWNLASETEPDRLTHGFHTYPGRMHPAVAARALADLAGNGTLVLDPFCGGGTVPVESMVAGCDGIGVDLNPLALRIAQVRCDLRDAAAIERFRQISVAVGEASEDRVRSRVDSRAPLPKWELQWYQMHILKELAGLWAEIGEVPKGPDRNALEMVFSAMVVKFSRQRSETSDQREDRRLRKGLVTEFFVRKSEELAERWSVLAETVPAGTPPPRFIEGDARRLPRLLARKRVDLILTSPPYGGTYDYVEHHARRYPWFGLSTRRFRDGELGARRKYSKGGGADWDTEVVDMLTSMARVLSPGGLAILLVGDAQVGRRRIEADAQLEHLAPRAGLRFLAAASQVRPDWQGGKARAEHLVVLGPGPKVQPPAAKPRVAPDREGGQTSKSRAPRTPRKPRRKRTK